MMVKIAHMADLHLDSPLVQLKDIKMSAQRRAEMVETFFSAIDRCVREKVDIVLLAGDIFENITPSADICQKVIAKMEQEKNLLFFISPGNHDYIHPASPYCQMGWPENVTIFKTNEMEKVSLGGKNVYIWGAAFTAPILEKSVLSGFRVEDPEAMNIGVLHGELVAGQSPYGPVSMHDIEKSGLDYLALGHIHSFTGMQKAGKCSYCYPGCMEPRGFDELGEKGFIIAQLDKEEENRFYFCPINRRKYVEMAVDINGLSKVQDICAKIKEVTGESGEHLFKICLVGDVEAANTVDPAQIARQLEAEYYYIKVINETNTAHEYYEIAKERTLTGIFTADLLKKIEESVDPLEKETWEIALRMGYQALTGREVEML